ncbi:DUF1214 domain-containing protein [Mycobacterium sp. 663a-19]|uniref:DUF1214 domain-containing protein n=1 Tax=Mycobacterium sp. 663a-19 TaxID=2986148 RepID=UPI002D1F3AAD|nr:DUF1214 domain-containing protein [Mycobacterium sp. 663a-19]MEB3981651.1 DUF1214 domain-containing protein [Mycobacterium sp. 663a-19]
MQLRLERGNVGDPKKPLAWLPFSIAEAPLSGAAGDVDPSRAWSHLMDGLRDAARVVESDPACRNRVDFAAGMRHLLVLLAAGIDEALRFDPDPVLCVQRTSTDDILTWGMECPDCLYTRAVLRGGERYRLFGNRGTARYVGLQTMNGIAATANELVDELEVDADGNFEVVLSASEPTGRAGNWMRIEGKHPTLTVRHFFYDWETETASSLRIERLGDAAPATRPAVDPDAALSRQLIALGDFVQDNLAFFLQFGAAPPPNGFLPPIDRTDIGAAAENKPVIGRWELDRGEALIVEVEPPEGIYWSFSIGNPWWETIHYGRHQSSLNAHQAAVDSDGRVRVVLCAEDPGVANWLDTAGHSNGPIILRCVRTKTAPTPTTRLVSFDDVRAELPGTATVTTEERAAVLATRRRAVRERFGR